MKKVNVRYECVICGMCYNSKNGANKCYDDHFESLRGCHFCNKSLGYNDVDNVVDGGSVIKVIAGNFSRHSGKSIENVVICDDCWDKQFEFIGDGVKNDNMSNDKGHYICCEAYKKLKECDGCSSGIAHDFDDDCYRKHFCAVISKEVNCVKYGGKNMGIVHKWC